MGFYGELQRKNDTRISYRCTEQEKQEVKILSIIENTTMSAIISKAIEEFILNHEYQSALTDFKEMNREIIK